VLGPDANSNPGGPLDLVDAAATVYDHERPASQQERVLRKRDAEGHGTTHDPTGLAFRFAISFASGDGA
jgi:hypothetical protein